MKKDVNARKTINKKTATKLETDCHIRFLEHCHNGGSIPQFCRQERISRTTFDAWCEKYPHMRDAKACGKLWAEGWWMDQAKNHLIVHNEHECGTTKFDTNLYKFYMAGRFGHTSDKLLLEALERLEEKQNAILGMKPTSQMAEEAECEPYTGMTNSEDE